MRAQSACIFGLLAGASLFSLEPALAQSDSEKIEKLQLQMEQLQKQIKALQGEIAQKKSKTEKADAEKVGHAARTPDRDAPKSPIAKAPSWTDKVKITLGGFVTADTVFRNRNQVNDIGTSFTGIPYPFSPLYGEHEFHGSARASRLAVLAEGNIDPVQKLAAYWESDFLGVAANSNYTETNSWALRVRNAYLTYDNTAWGFHLLAGQSWSLLTQNTIGITPRKENIPLTIEADYVDGFNYTRGWQLRLVKDFGQKVWLGVSVETPAMINAGVPGGTSTVNGLVINAVNTGRPGKAAIFVDSRNAFMHCELQNPIAMAVGECLRRHHQSFGLSHRQRLEASLQSVEIARASIVESDFQLLRGELGFVYA
jgi:hypothetical protein